LQSASRGPLYQCRRDLAASVKDAQDGHGLGLVLVKEQIGRNHRTPYASAKGRARASYVGVFADKRKPVHDRAAILRSDKRPGLAGEVIKDLVEVADGGARKDRVGH
jgi:hypothetical protein